MVPYNVKKTSVYLDEEDVDRLRRLAEREARSQAAIIRAALLSYERTRQPDKNFSLNGAWEGDGSAVADLPEAELLEGFGS